MLNASHTSCAGMVGAMDQPTMRREYRSSTAARYSQPLSVRMYVTSHTQSRIGCFRLKLTVEHVLCHRQMVFAIGGMSELATPTGLESTGFHQGTTAMTSNIMAPGTQGCTQTTTAIGATTGKKNRLSMHAVWQIGLGVLTLRRAA